MKFLFLSSLSLLLLAACATIIDHPTQMVTIRTPGATNAKCTLYNEDMKYIAYTDQMIEIMKSPHDLAVNCKASGNREKTIALKRDINGWVAANVVNGFVPGAVYDYFSRGAFEYPAEITVSFVGEQVKRYPLPDYMSDELHGNHQYGEIEYMGPGTMITEDTKYDQPGTLEKKVDVYVQPMPVEPAPMPLDDIHKKYNPRVYDPSEEDK